VKVIIVYITLANIDLAKKIARHLVECQYAACVNIFPNITSLYEWQGEVVESGEVVMIVKTTRDKFVDIENFIISSQQYETPCVISIKIDDGNKKFLKWIENYTSYDIN
jgi:periplasmic divalent cation tolerance protein